MREAGRGSEEDSAEIGRRRRASTTPEKIALTATGPHALLDRREDAGARNRLRARGMVAAHAVRQFRADAGARARTARARCSNSGSGKGRILLSAGGSLFTNRALGNDDNARLFSNIVSAQRGARRRGAVRRSAPGTVGELRSRALLSGSAPVQTMLILLALWLVWVLGSTRLRAPAHRRAMILPRPNWCGAPAG